jgi:hypothetical protein
VVNLLILREVSNAFLLDFRFPVYGVRCRHFENAFYEEVKFYPSSKNLERLDLVMWESNIDEVS